MGGKVKTSGMLQGRKGNGKKDLHPNSRRLKQATRVDLRNKKVADAKKERLQTEKAECARLLWFVKNLDPARSHLDIKELHEHVALFINRLDEDIAAEQKARRAGRPKSKHHEELEAAKARDELEYAKEGLLIPDLTDKDSVVSGRYWDQKLNGKAGYLPRLRLVRIFKGNDELVLEQSGAAPGTKAKDAGLEVEDSEMQE